MNPKTIKIIYYISTGLLTLMMLGSTGMYFFNTAEVSKTFVSLGFPTYLVYPLATAKLLGLVAIWTGKSKFLKEWAYAGFFFNFDIAFIAHVMVGDGQFGGALIAMVLLLTSYIMDRQRNKAAA